MFYLRIATKCLSRQPFFDIDPEKTIPLQASDLREARLEIKPLLRIYYDRNAISYFSAVELLEIDNVIPINLAEVRNEISDDIKKEAEEVQKKKDLAILASLMSRYPEEVKKLKKCG